MIQEFGDSTQVRPDVQTLIAFIVTLQLRVTVGSIRNSWNVFFKKLFIQLLNHLLVDNIGHVSLLVRHHIIYFVINLSILREAPRRLALHLFGHCPNSDYTPPALKRALWGTFFPDRFEQICQITVLTVHSTNIKNVHKSENFQKISRDYIAS